MLISVSHLDADLRGNYVLSALAAFWTANGIGRVSVGRDYRDTADLCILHHDLTTLEPADLPAPPEGVPVVNANCHDISKTRVSTLSLSAGEDWDGPVIVKTVLNHFGGPERRRAARSRLGRLVRSLGARAWQHTRILPRSSYPVLPGIAAVPDWVWRDERLIVERFMPERDGDLYCLRGWLCFGDRGYGYRLFATDPMVKTGTMVRHEYLFEPPPEVAEWRGRFAVDFAKFDYVEHDGRAILLDVNKTPTFAGPADTPRLRLLADGIGAFR
ncbi:MAG: hypothetical protein ACPGID_08945 [Rubricella sp.]